MLTDDRKWQHVEAAHEFLHTCETYSRKFLDSIVTEDDTWVHYMTPEMKRHSCQWKHAELLRPQKYKQTPSASKVMASVFLEQ